LLNLLPASFFHFQFAMFFLKPEDEGFYDLYFHKCDGHKTFLNFHAEIEEANLLSVDKMPLPLVYFIMSLLFGVLVVSWLTILANNRKEVKKVHYLISAVVILKSLSLLIQSINLKLIATHGEPIVFLQYFNLFLVFNQNQQFFGAIAITYKKFKFVFQALVVVLILQFFSAFAAVGMEMNRDAPEGPSLWNDLYILTDTICCILILLPALCFGEKNFEHENSANSKKMKVHQRFYITFVCYTFSSRIVG
jgi:G protein-coupled receptor 107